MCDNYSIWYPFWLGVGIYFLIDIRGWVKSFLLFIASAKFLPRKTIPFGASPC
jgi:hypothetical protein